MSKLEIGMYVRTKSGYILKFEEYVDWCNNMCFEFQIGEKEVFFQKTITKSSFNLIELIKVGDIITFEIFNEIKTSEVIEWNKYNLGVYYEYKNELCFLNIEALKIKSVLTKEKYEANCYKVVE